MYFFLEMQYFELMLTNTDTALIRLYYEDFGLGPAEIAAALGVSKPVVTSLVEEQGLQAPAEVKLNEDKRKALVERNLDKQMVLEPYYARAEVTVLGKIIDVASSIAPDQIDAVQKLSACARALKDLQSTGVQAKLDNTAEAAGVTVQILNQL